MALPLVRRLRWQAWLRHPTDEGWARVSRWHTPADVFAAATDPARDATARAALGAFCARHGMAPENAAERAVFFVLTGDAERYAALDPDGTLLAAGYRGAGEPTREALRHTMVGLGELDLVRVVAGPDRPLSAAEGDYLARRLAASGEWARLWRLLPALPLADAARAVRLFDDWRPPDDAGRAWFERLARANPDVLAALDRVAVTPVDVIGATVFSFAPDGTELAVARRSGTTVFAVPGGDPIATHDGNPGNVVALGGGAIIHHGNASDDWVIARRAPERQDEVLLPDRSGLTIGSTHDGFYVVTRRDGVRFGDRDGSWSRVVRRAEPPLDVLAVDPARGRLALIEPGALVVVDTDLTPLAAGKITEYEILRGAFLTPDRLITRGSGANALVSWQVDGTDLVRTAATRLLVDHFPAPVPGHGDRMVVPHRGGPIWVHAETLAETDPPPGFPPLDGEYLVFSPDGLTAVVAAPDRVELHDLAEHRLAELARRSLAELVRDDRDTVAALTGRVRDSAVLDLVRTGLEYRFGADIALGLDDPPLAGSTDIALGDG